ncbi:MAG: hypothetical protein ICV83_31280, partial [Cytophagales bacterium]|nr:hypothetical protein [Cytophagales bacterium]
MQNRITSHPSTPLPVRRTAPATKARTLLLLGFLLALLGLPARGQYHTWTVPTSNVRDGWAPKQPKVVAGKDGNTYVLTPIDSTFTVGGTTFTPQGNGDLLVINYKADGTVGWARQIASTVAGYPGDIGLNPANSLLYVAGAFSKTVKFPKADGSAATEFTGTGVWNGFVAQYDLAGNFQWARHLSSPTSMSVKGLDVDANDRVYLVGDFGGTASFPGSAPTLTGTGEHDIYLARYGKTGLLELARRLEAGPGWNLGNAIAVNPQNGDIYLTGGYGVPGVGSMPTFWYSKVLVACYNAQGTLQWSKSYGTSSRHNEGSDIVATAQGIYVTGNFFGSIAFGATALTSNGIGDVFVAYYPYALNGGVEWVRQYGGSAQEFAGSLAYRAWDNGPGGDLYVTGSFYGTATFGNTILSNPNNVNEREVFLAHLTPGGTPDWARKIGGAGTDIAGNISLSGSSTLFVTAYHHKP